MSALIRSRVGGLLSVMCLAVSVLALAACRESSAQGANASPQASEKPVADRPIPACADALWNAGTATVFDSAMLARVRAKLGQELDTTIAMAKAEPQIPGVPDIARRLDHLNRAFAGDVVRAKIAALDAGQVRLWRRPERPPIASPYSSIDGQEVGFFIAWSSHEKGEYLLFKIEKSEHPVAYDASKAVWDLHVSEEYRREVKKAFSR